MPTERTITMHRLLIIASALGFTAPCYAETLKPIPLKANPYSYFYDIIDVHEAEALNTRVRVFDVPTVGQQASLTQVLHVVADNRPPNMAKASRVAIWNLGARFRTVYDVAIVDSQITIKGGDYESGPGVCTYSLQFKDGVLKDDLDDRGCKWGDDAPVSMVVYLIAGATNDQIHVVWSSLDAEGGGFLPGIAMIHRTTPVEGHAAVAVTLTRSATANQIAAIHQRLAACEVVYRVLDNVAPSEVKALP